MYQGDRKLPKELQEQLASIRRGIKHSSHDYDLTSGDAALSAVEELCDLMEAVLFVIASVPEVAEEEIAHQRG